MRPTFMRASESAFSAGHLARPATKKWSDGKTSFMQAPRASRAATAPDCERSARALNDPGSRLWSASCLCRRCVAATTSRTTRSGHHSDGHSCRPLCLICTMGCPEEGGGWILKFSEKLMQGRAKPAQSACDRSTPAIRAKAGARRTWSAKLPSADAARLLLVACPLGRWRRRQRLGEDVTPAHAAVL